VSAFCEEFLHSAQSYVAKYPVQTATAQLGSRTVNVSVPLRTWADNIDPVGGLQASKGTAGEADFTIILFENAEDARLPLAWWPSEWHFPLGQLPQEKTQRYRVAVDRHTATVSVFDTVTRLCAVWVYEVRRLPYWWLATPFRLQFSWLADTFDAELAHAGAIRSNGKVSLFTGLSGRGKSTLAHLLGSEGFEVMSDDFVVLEGMMISGPYTRTKLHDSSISVLPHLREKVMNLGTPGEKRILRDVVSVNHEPGELTEVFTVRFGNNSRISATAKAPVYRELVLGTIPGVLGGSRRSLMRLSKAVSSTSSSEFATSRSLAMTLQTWKDHISA